jgi:hypothetical protein
MRLRTTPSDPRNPLRNTYLSLYRSRTRVSSFLCVGVLELYAAIEALMLVHDVRFHVAALDSRRVVGGGWSSG